MSVHAQPERAAGAPEAAQLTAPGDAAYDGDALPVIAGGPAVSGVRPLGGLSRPAPPALVPAVQAAAAAAGGFLAGAAVIGLVNRRHRRPARTVARPRAGRAARGRRPARRGEIVQIVGSRSLLVDVHLLAER